MNMPIISIILPTFNGEKYILQTIQSCIQQTFADWELIIVDDGSTDDTPNIIASYIASDKRIRSVKHPSNKKLPAALNTGFSIAKGHFFTWISDDNIFYQNALQKMLETLNKNPTTDIVYADMDIINDTGQKIGKWPVRDVKLLGYRGNTIGGCFLYRRNVHESLRGFREDFFLAEDYHFWLLASENFIFYRIKEPLYGYRQHDLSLTSRNDEIINKTQEMLKNTITITQKKWLKAGILVHMAVNYRLQKLYKESLKYLLRAFATCPVGVLLYSPKLFFLS